jgi:hypothetical protein
VREEIKKGLKGTIERKSKKRKKMKKEREGRKNINWDSF